MGPRAAIDEKARLASVVYGRRRRRRRRRRHRRRRRRRRRRLEKRGIQFRMPPYERCSRTSLYQETSLLIVLHKVRTCLG